MVNHFPLKAGPRKAMKQRIYKPIVPNMSARKQTRKANITIPATIPDKIKTLFLGA